MFGWGETRNAYNQCQQTGNTSSFSHEVIGGGAAFAAMKVFEDRQRKEGKPVSHAFAKEMIAGIAGAEVDKLAETKGADAWDRHEAKQHAEKQAKEMYDDQYGGNDQYDPNTQDAPSHFGGNFDHSW